MRIGPEPILPTRDLNRTRAFTLKDPSGNLARVGHELDQS